MPTPTFYYSAALQDSYPFHPKLKDILEFTSLVSQSIHRSPLFLRRNFRKTQSDDVDSADEKMDEYTNGVTEDTGGSQGKKRRRIVVIGKYEQKKKQSWEDTDASEDDGLDAKISEMVLRLHELFAQPGSHRIARKVFRRPEKYSNLVVLRYVLAVSSRAKEVAKDKRRKESGGSTHKDENGVEITRICASERWSCLFCHHYCRSTSFQSLLLHFRKAHPGFRCKQISARKYVHSGVSSKSRGTDVGTENDEEWGEESTVAVLVEADPDWWADFGVNKSTKNNRFVKTKVSPYGNWGWWHGKFWKLRSAKALKGLSMSRLNRHVEDIWSRDVDGEVESDADWRLTEKEVLLSDYNDTRAQEVIFMSLWNRFVTKYNLFADRQVESCLVAFAESHRSVIRKLLLGDMFILHMNELYKRGLIDRLSIACASEEMLKPGGECNERDYPILEMAKEKLQKLKSIQH